MPSLTYQYSDIEIIIGHGCYHAIRPLEVHGDNNRNSPLSAEIQEKFIEWHTGLPILGRLTIFDTPVDQIELHMFGDSSQNVFCSVAFLRGRSVVTNEAKFFCFQKN